MKPGGMRILNAIYNFDRSDDFTPFHGFMGWNFDSRFHLANGLVSQPRSYSFLVMPLAAWMATLPRKWVFQLRFSMSFPALIIAHAQG
jgi:hypothetical protein